MEYVIVIALLLAVVFVLSTPWRRHTLLGEARPEPLEAPVPAPELVDLEAARDAKYREIRDAELDHQTGKLSDEDYAAIDSTLRAEAIEILRHLDEVSGRDPEPVGSDPRGA